MLAERGAQFIEHENNWSSDGALAVIF